MYSILKKTTNYFFVLFVFFVAIRFAEGNNTPPLQKPNILVIVADNLGHRDVGYNGSEIRTPNIDALAATGVRLDQFYVYPMCSPTRAAFISGRAPSRYDILGAIGHRSRQALPTDTVTLADVLARQGYDTAISGKWHLGLRPEVGPLQYGFHQSYGFLHGQIDKRSHRYKNGDQSWHRNDEFIDEKGHCLDLITVEALRIIRAPRENPFFLYVPFGAPHPPLQEDSHWIEPYKKTIQQPSRQHYAAAVTHMDDAIGQLLTALYQTGQSKNTLVVFFSDNGAIEKLPRQAKNYADRFGPYPKLGDNGPYRGWIGQLYDGCLRTPAVVHWPGRLKQSVVKEMTSVLDLFPTLAQVAQGKTDPELQLEGRNIWPLLTGKGPAPPTTLYWKTSAGKAVRSGNWKLVVKPGQNTTELFRIDQDPYEKNNLAKKHPDQVEQLEKLIDAHSQQDR